VQKVQRWTLYFRVFRGLPHEGQIQLDDACLFIKQLPKKNVSKAKISFLKLVFFKTLHGRGLQDAILRPPATWQYFKDALVRHPSLKG
jgi:hypothetical protein